MLIPLNNKTHVIRLGADQSYCNVPSTCKLALEQIFVLVGNSLVHFARKRRSFERINEEIKRRTLVVRIFPNAASCLRLVRALAAEIHEEWIEATRYLNMELLVEHKREQLRRRAAA